MAKLNPFATAPHSLQEWLLGMYAPGWPSGTTWYVHSGDGTNEAYDANGSERGLSPGKPFASLAYAIADPAVVASRNTQIVLLPGHTETITGAAGVNLNKIGIRVVGEGYGRNRPLIDFTTDSAASFDINSASCSVTNCAFKCSIDAQTAMINVKAADFLLEDCEIQLADSSYQATVGILTTASADRMILRRNHMHGTIDAGTATAIQIVGGSDARIENNLIIGAFTTTLGGINIITTAAVNLLIGNNVINNRTASSTKCIVDTITGTTGQIFNNRMQILSGSTPITAAAMSWVGGNYYAATVATAGTLI